MSRFSVSNVLRTWYLAILATNISDVNSTVAPAYNILLLPVDISSHVMFFGRFAEALTEEGHSVSMIVSSKSKAAPNPKTSGVKLIHYDTKDTISYVNSPKHSMDMVRIAMANSTMEQYNIYVEIMDPLIAAWNEGCEIVLSDNILMEELRNKKFDHVIVDLVGITCMYVIPYSLGVPYSTFSIPMATFLFRVPDLPSQVPHMMTLVQGQMSFWERLNNAILTFSELLFVNRPTIHTERFAKERPKRSTLELFQQSTLWFWLDDMAVSRPRPAMPNIITVGDLIGRPGVKLTGDLKVFMDSATQGAIVISFGSFVDYLPHEKIIQICRALANVEESIVWKILSSDPCGNILPANNPRLKLVNWIPQNDILAHPNLKLFITHCGLNSVIESIYHGKPMLGIPLAHDQPFNAELLQEKGYGKRLKFATFTSTDLEREIRTIIHNSSFATSAQKGGHILRDKTESAGKRASFWLKHVIKYGDEHLRTKAFTLNLPQFFMVDIYLFILILVCVFVSVMVVGLICCVKLIKRRCCKKQKHKHE